MSALKIASAFAVLMTLGTLAVPSASAQDDLRVEIQVRTPPKNPPNQVWPGQTFLARTQAIATYTRRSGDQVERLVHGPYEMTIIWPNGQLQMLRGDTRNGSLRIRVPHGVGHGPAEIRTRMTGGPAEGLGDGPVIVNVN